MDTNALETLIQSNPNIACHVYIPSKVPEAYVPYVGRNLTVTSAALAPTVGVGPCEFLLSLVRAGTIQAPVVFPALVRQPHVEEAIRLIDQCQLGDNATETGILFSGVYESKTLNELALAGTPQRNASNYEKFRCLFLQPPEIYRATIVLGRNIAEHNLHLAAERVLNNSGVFTLAGGKKAVVSTAPELIAMTHSQLRELYQSESPDVSITLTYNFGAPGKPSVANVYSIRSYVPEVDAGELAKRLGGGGDAKSAGARVTLCDFKLGL